MLPWTELQEPFPSHCLTQTVHHMGAKKCRSNKARIKNSPKSKWEAFRVRSTTFTTVIRVGVFLDWMPLEEESTDWGKWDARNVVVASAILRTLIELEITYSKPYIKPIGKGTIKNAFLNLSINTAGNLT